MSRDNVGRLEPWKNRINPFRFGSITLAGLVIDLKIW